MQLPALASCSDFSILSPSLAADLSRCFYRAAQLRVPAMQAILHRHPAALLGTVAHRVLDRARRRDFVWPEGIAILSQSDAKYVSTALWNMEVVNVAAQAVPHSLITDPRKWPGYALHRARTIHHSAARLTGLVKPNEVVRRGAVERRTSEKTLTTSSGDLTGVPDNLLLTDRGIILEEFKTGNIRDDQGTILQRYRDQLNIYAYLVKAVHGQWPLLVRLDTIEGESHQEVPNPAEAEELVQRIRALLVEYRNALAEAGSDPKRQMFRLASPSKTSCYGCAIRAWCEPFWLSGVRTHGSRNDIRGLLAESWKGSGPLWLNTVNGTVSVAGLLGWHHDLRLEQGIQVYLLNIKSLPSAHAFLFDGYSELWWRGGEQ
jgi:hypothetical protein